MLAPLFMLVLLVALALPATCACATDRFVTSGRADRARHRGRNAGTQSRSTMSSSALSTKAASSSSVQKRPHAREDGDVVASAPLAAVELDALCAVVDAGSCPRGSI